MGLQLTPSVHSSPAGVDETTSCVPSYVQSSLRLRDADTTLPCAGASTDGTSVQPCHALCSAGLHGEPSDQHKVDFGGGFTTVTWPSNVQSSFIETDALTTSPGPGSGTEGAVAALLHEVTASGLQVDPCVHESVDPGAGFTSWILESYVQSAFRERVIETVSPAPGEGGAGIPISFWATLTSTGRHADPSVQEWTNAPGAFVTANLASHVQSSLRWTSASRVSPDFTAGTAGIAFCAFSTSTERCLHAEPSVQE